MKTSYAFFLLLSIILTLPAISKAQNANVNDSLALVNLYDSTDGPNWSTNTGWLKGPVNQWSGITLDDNGRVIFVYLNGYNLRGKIPWSIGNLTNVQQLFLSANPLSGSIPTSIGNLANLQMLLLYSDELTDSIPSSIGKLTNLQYLDVSGNRLSGLPLSMGKLNNLTYLNINHNELNSILPALGNLTNLQTLDLSFNQLTGGIPASLGNLTQLQTLYLEYNNLTGSIPASLGNLTKLYNMILGNNQLSGKIPPSLGNDTFLFELNLGYNQLTGAIPAQLGNIHGLSRLILCNNQLSDTIPASLGNLIWLTDLKINGNQITGAIPTTLGSMSHLVELDLSYNNISGNIPTSLGNIKTLNFTYLNNNQLSGPIPPTLAKNNSLLYLYLNNNKLNGPIPATFSNFTAIRSMHLENNYLTFDGMELIANQYSPVTIYAPQYKVALHLNNHKISVSAGGTLVNNTFRWYNGDTLKATIYGDSSYTPAYPGTYSAAISNSIAAKLTLYSDTIVISKTLPVTYLDIKLTSSHDGNLLSWQTASEINSNYFNVQRSANGLQFLNIGTVSAKENSATVQYYLYNDNLNGLTHVPPSLYYRLQSVDKNGLETYSKIVRADYKSTRATLQVFPNPVRNELTAFINTNNGPLDFTVTSADGKKMVTKQLNEVNNQTIKLNTSAWPSGVYFLQVSFYGGQTILQKVVKE